MVYRIQYQNQDERQSIIDNNVDKYLIEEQNITEGNFLIFTDEKPITEELNDLKRENVLLKAQSQANSNRADFQEDLIVEMAMMVYQ